MSKTNKAMEWQKAARLINQQNKVYQTFYKSKQVRMNILQIKT